MSPTPTWTEVPVDAAGRLLHRRQTPASSTVSSAPSSTNSNNNFWGGTDQWAGNRSQILNWAAIAVVVGLMISIAGWRLVTMRNRTWKNFFLPRGLRVKWLHIDIKPPPRPTPPTGLVELEEARRQRRAEERFQRRRTRGDNVAEGGQRLDATYEGEEQEDGVDRESLPGYKADTSAPVYLEEWREQATQDGTLPDDIDDETADAIRRSGPVVDSDAPAAEENHQGMLSVAEYEARIGGGNNAAEAAADTQVTNPSSDAPTIAYPPSAAVMHLRRPEPVRTATTTSIPPDYDNLSRRPSISSERRA